MAGSTEASIDRTSTRSERNDGVSSRDKLSLSESMQPSPSPMASSTAGDDRQNDIASISPSCEDIARERGERPSILPELSTFTSAFRNSRSTSSPSEKPDSRSRHFESEIIEKARQELSRSKAKSLMESDTEESDIAIPIRNTLPIFRTPHPFNRDPTSTTLTPSAPSRNPTSLTRSLTSPSRP